jgi:hypothetical protein
MDVEVYDPLRREILTCCKLAFEEPCLATHHTFCELDDGLVPGGGGGLVPFEELFVPPLPLPEPPVFPFRKLKSYLNVPLG